MRIDTSNGCQARWPTVRMVSTTTTDYRIRAGCAIAPWVIHTWPTPPRRGARGPEREAQIGGGRGDASASRVRGQARISQAGPDASPRRTCSDGKCVHPARRSRTPSGSADNPGSWGCKRARVPAWYSVLLHACHTSSISTRRGNRAVISGLAVMRRGELFRECRVSVNWMKNLLQPFVSRVMREMRMAHGRKRDSRSTS